ncbi:uncharacterized protein M421DRAFT_342666 [Didymella exigua CBS 183.55]|uniref:Uncharacterized protein n=1 Tax=Didymella exigua CBS 183.55 TaxID=1150837 RepID=A0A6A5RTS8_9PLEO|nr:uncharacterized protein M421DRAFT_342666 [Didymella exigua CBS 183.55]KAF1931252.1 hypothetical protein M421DRAFT_342666 [Didymella exigua CBS 183.55]
MHWPSLHLPHSPVLLPPSPVLLPPSLVLLPPSPVLLPPSLVLLPPSLVLLPPSLVLLPPSLVLLGLIRQNTPPLKLRLPIALSPPSSRRVQSSVEPTTHQQPSTPPLRRHHSRPRRHRIVKLRLPLLSLSFLLLLPEPALLFCRLHFCFESASLFSRCCIALLREALEFGIWHLVAAV